MTRTENDTWDLASSVGATATMVAAARAMASKTDHALIDDPFAEPLVRAVGVDLFTRLASGDLRPEDLDGDADAGMQRMTDTITALSAPGSRFATESAPNIDPADQDRLIERMRTASQRWRDHGFDLDISELVYLGDRNEAEAYLAEHGWQITGASINELFAANGLPPFDGDAPFANLRYIDGTLAGR